MCSRRLLTLGGSLAALLIAGSALAQGLPKEDQKCIDQYNNKLRLVSQQAGKSARKCVKDAAKAGSDPDACVVTNTDGKIAGKEAKVTALYTDLKCTGAEVIQQGAATGNAAHRNAITDFIHTALGDPVGVLPINKDDGKCLDKGVQRSTQAITEIIKAHRKCKKDAMKAGTVTDEATLDATCGTFAQIDGGGKAAAKLAKLSADVGAACAVTTTPISGLFDGLDAGCHASAGALGTCLVSESRCTACLILNEADGQSMDCDAFDDNSANGSCGFVSINVGAHTCTLGGGSLLALGTQALPLNVVPSGTIDITCGATAPGGKASCTCEVDSFAPIVIPAIGDVCVNPAPGCPAGEIDCDGGNSLNVDLVADHNIGACASDTACAASCDAYCGGLGGTYSKANYGCEGFCQGGVNNDVACAADTFCTGGSCTGADPPGHAGTCNCACQGVGLGGASAAGSLACAVGTQIDVELPTDGDCLDANTISLSPICGEVTTTTASGRVIDANNMGGKTIPPVGGVGVAPNVQNGVGIDCNTASGSTLTGLTMVGHLGFFDSTLGDIFAANKFVCQ